MTNDKKPGSPDVDLLAELIPGVQKLGHPQPRRAPPPTAARVPPAPTAPVPAARPPVDERTLLREAFADVRPLGGATRGGSAPGRPAVSPAAPRGGDRGPVGGLATPRTSAPLNAPSPELFAHVQAEHDRLANELSALRERHAALEDDAASLRRALAEAQREAAESAAALAAAVSALNTSRLELARAQDRDRERQRRLDALAQAPKAETSSGKAVPTDLRTLLQARGLQGEAEMNAAMGALAAAGRLGPFYTRLASEEAHALGEFLVERLVLVGPGEAADGGRAAVEVPVERSDDARNGAIATALSAFSEACLLAGKRRVLVVGGSPAYHKQLKAGVDRRIQLTLVDGSKKNFRTLPHADLTVVWGATELDHSTSAHFPDAVQVSHRGISVMLEQVTARLRA
jgi:hypothetical protein